MIAGLKFLHIAALSIWCAGLIGLPLLLARHSPADEQAVFSRLRIVTHRTYVAVVTPAAVLAIALGTALIFVRNLFVPWMFAKLVLVGVLVLLHVWLGHVTVQTGEQRGAYETHSAGPFLAASLVAMTAILLLVLGKPLIEPGIMPAWLLSPRGQPLPIGEVPS